MGAGARGCGHCLSAVFAAATRGRPADFFVRARKKGKKTASAAASASAAHAGGGAGGDRHGPAAAELPVDTSGGVARRATLPDG